MSSKSSSVDTRGREAKLAAIRKQNEADKRRQRIIALVTAGIIVILAGVVGVVIYQASQERATLAGEDPTTLVEQTYVAPPSPDGAAGEGDGNVVSGFAVGPDDAAATVTVFEDYLCPACKQFEEAFGTYVDGLPEQGVRVVYSPVTILDDRSQGTRYSSRAASAAACVAEQDDADLTQFKTFTDLLFLNQPAEGTQGLESTVLADYADQAGAPGTVRDCIVDDRYMGWSERSNEAAAEAGLRGTPTIWVNGSPVDSSQDAIQAAIDAAGGGTAVDPSAPAEPSGAASN